MNTHGVQSSGRRHASDYAENRAGYDLDGNGRVGSGRASKQYHDDRVSYRRYGEEARREAPRESRPREARRSRSRSRSRRREGSKKGPGGPAQGSMKQPAAAPPPQEDYGYENTTRVASKDYEVWPPPGMMWYVDEDPPNGKLERRPPSPPSRDVHRSSGTRTVKITNLSETSVPSGWAAHPSPHTPQRQQNYLPSPYRHQPVQHSPLYHTPPQHQSANFHPQYTQSPPQYGYY